MDGVRDYSWPWKSPAGGAAVLTRIIKSKKKPSTCGAAIYRLSARPKSWLCMRVLYDGAWGFMVSQVDADSVLRRPSRRFRSLNGALIKREEVGKPALQCRVLRDQVKQDPFAVKLEDKISLCWKPTAVTARRLYRSPRLA